MKCRTAVMKRVYHRLPSCESGKTETEGLELLVPSNLKDCRNSSVVGTIIQNFAMRTRPAVIRAHPATRNATSHG
jgi:hypothetical protein